MLGKPIYKRDDVVKVDVRGVMYAGKVYIVDQYGCFECSGEEPSYDVMITYENGEKCLVKHIRESELLKMNIE